MGEHEAAESAVMTHDEMPIARNDDGLPPDVAALMQEFTGAKYNKLMRKLDLHLIPIVSFTRDKHGFSPCHGS